MAQAKTSGLQTFLQNITVRILFGTLFATLVPAGLIGTILFFQLRTTTLTTTEREVLTDLAIHAENIRHELDERLRDVQSLAQTPAVQGIQRAQSHDGIDPVDGTAYELWQERLAEIFIARMETHQDFLQLRLLNHVGTELVRVDRIDGYIIRVPDEALQDKSDRHYVQTGLAREVGQWHISNMELNREGTPPEIIEPWEPVLRYVVPFANDETGEVGGLVILNTSAEAILTETEQTEQLTEPGTHTGLFYKHLYDSRGYYLLHEQPDLAWSGPENLGTLHRLEDTIGEEEMDLLLTQSGILHTIEDISYAQETIVFDRFDPSTTWLLVTETPRSAILARFRNTQRILIPVFVAFILIAWLIAYWLSQLISRPLEQLTTVARHMGDGDYDDRFPVTTDDVIGKLGTTFNTMADKISTYQKNMEAMVEDRTVKLNSELGKAEDTKRAMLNILEDFEEEKAKFSSSFKAAAIGIALVGTKGEWLEVNDALPNIVGYTKEELLQMTFQDITHPEDLDEDLGLLQEVLDNKRDRYQIQKRYIHKQGFTVWVLLSVACVRNPDKTVKYFISQILDITKLKEVDKAKTEFVSLASHQLRTPLTSINWYAEMLLDGDAGKLTDQQREYVREIYIGNQRMVDLVNALLNVSRIELGTFMVEPQPIHLPGLAEELIRELEPVIASKQLRLQKEFEPNFPELLLDPKLIGIVLQNLLSNAVKYTPAQGVVTVRLKTTQDAMRIEVADTGMGIPEDQKSKIFTKLFRADNVLQMDADGTGLGLYLVKSIIESSNGRVWFDSTEGKGTTFYVELPKTGMQARSGSKPLEPTKLPSPEKTSSED